jgi:hypothetical protein
MRGLAVQAARDWNFIKMATPFAQQCPRDYRCQADRILTWVKKNITFVPDPVSEAGADQRFLGMNPSTDQVAEGIEMVQAPMRTLERRAGDCDCIGTLIAALAMSLGIPAQYVTIKSDMRRPEEFSHVYPRLLVNGVWLAADPTVPSSVLGWEPPRQWGKTEWRI